MTTDAIRRGALELIADVACTAFQRSVSPGQRESGVLQVVELHPKPVVEIVALVAGCRKAGRSMSWAGGSLVILRVAGIAFRRHQLILRGRKTFVTSVAFDGGVGPQQRKTVLVLLNLLERDLPAFHRVALFAIRSKLALMNVGMTVSAFHADIGEHRLDVALLAGHRLVHPAKRIGSLAVIEFGNAADRFPAAERMAILARNVQVAVRTSGVRGILPGRVTGRCRNEKQHPQDCVEHSRRHQHYSPDFGHPAAEIELRKSGSQTSGFINATAYAIRRPLRVDGCLSLQKVSKVGVRCAESGHVRGGYSGRPHSRRM